MKLRLWREIGIWILALLFSVAMMSWSPAPFRIWGQVPDFLFATQIFAAYYFREARSLSVCLAAGFLRDLLYGLVLGPDMLSSVLIYALGSRVLSSKFNRSLWWIYPQALWIYPLSRIFRSLIFSLLPMENMKGIGLKERLASTMKYTIRSYPGMFIALTFVIILLVYLLPPLRERTSDRREIRLSEEHGQLW